MKSKVKRLLIIIVTIVIITVLVLYARNYYYNGDQKEHARVADIVKVYLENKYPDKKFIVKYKSYTFWYTLREFTVATEDDPQREYSILTEQDKITMDEYSNAEESK
ncbi:YfjL-like protein [Acetivibrio cellulolyticus]|uniref:YfjL-like protein n=1 Tax=Acetivibrio cellulolyticus TaxID=35830 RepID=UPI0001E2C220|nr:hypothetical protein [Acetivibrio cellulolyticus]